MGLQERLLHVFAGPGDGVACSPALQAVANLGALWWGCESLFESGSTVSCAEGRHKEEEERHGLAG